MFTDCSMNAVFWLNPLTETVTFCDAFIKPASGLKQSDGSSYFEPIASGNIWCYPCICRWGWVFCIWMNHQLLSSLFSGSTCGSLSLCQQVWALKMHANLMHVVQTWFPYMHNPAQLRLDLFWLRQEADVGQTTISNLLTVVALYQSERTCGWVRSWSSWTQT